MKVLLDINEEMPLETSEEYIDRMYDKVNSIDYKTLERKLKSDLTTFVSDLVSRNISNIKSENTRLEVENVAMKEQIQNFKMEIEFLREEIRSNRDKNSLDKDIDFVNFDLETPNASLLSSDKVEKTSLKLQKQLCDIRSEKHERYKVIKVNDTSNAEVNTKNTLNSQNDTLNSQKETKPANQHIRKNIVVCGDSIVNSVDGLGLSSKKVKASVRCFPGATTEDFLDYVKPIAKKKPEHIILHVGTNDLTRKSNTIENLVCVINEIKTLSKDTKVSVSSICLRKDKRDLELKVKSLNDEIEMFCKANHIDFLDNDNIDEGCLSKKKLHLNHKGTSRLAKNFKNYINSC